MKKIFKILGYIFLILILVVSGLLIYVKTALPNVGAAPQFIVDHSTEKIERGNYLANSVTVCVDCHSTRDWSRYLAPILVGTIGKGGERFDKKMGFPGIYFSRNITPAGISRYSDGELFRVITTGVTKDGRAMFPVMPYYYYGLMDPEDIKSIIAYLRTLTPIDNLVTESASDFPMNFIINTIPVKAKPVEIPAKSDRLAYGAYMTNASACIECHTPVKNGQILKEFAYSGGREFTLPDGSVVRSSNLTPDKQTGLGNWTVEQFTSRFKMYSDSTFKPQSVKPGDFNTIMPWLTYTHMKTEDLAAIFAFLKQTKTIKNTVVRFTAASQPTASK